VNTRLVGTISLITLILVALWAALLVWSIARGGVVETLDQALAHAQGRDAVYTLNYVNAVLVTLAATALFAALHVHFRRAAATWSAVGMVFVPVYCTLNVLVYASQVIIIPELAELKVQPGYEAAAAFFLGQMVQAWPGSTIAVVNGLAYAILAIPSSVFGALLYRGRGMMRIAGVLLVFNAVACIAGPIGLITGISALEIGTVVGGGLFLLALIPLTVAFLQEGRTGA